MGKKQAGTGSSFSPNLHDLYVQLPAYFGQFLWKVLTNPWKFLTSSKYCTFRWSRICQACLGQNTREPFFYYLAMRTLESHLISLGLSVLISKMGIIMSEVGNIFYFSRLFWGTICKTEIMTSTPFSRQGGCWYAFPPCIIPEGWCNWPGDRRPICWFSFMTSCPEFCSWDLRALECQNSETKGQEQNRLDQSRKIKETKRVSSSRIIKMGWVGWLVLKDCRFKRHPIIKTIRDNEYW